MAQGPSLFPCPACGSPVAYTAASCPHCGYRPPGAQTGNKINTSAIALGIGGLLIAVGSFLPWATVLGVLSRNGIDGGGDGMFTLAIGIVLVLVALATFGGGGFGWGSRLLGILGGIAAIAIAIIDGSDVAGRSSQYVSASIGMGIFVVGIGGAVAILAAIFGANRASATA